MSRDIANKNLNILKKHCSFCINASYIVKLRMRDKPVEEIGLLIPFSGFLIGESHGDELDCAYTFVKFDEALIIEIYVCFNHIFIENLLGDDEYGHVTNSLKNANASLLWSEKQDKQELQEIQQSITEDIMSKYRLV